MEGKHQKASFGPAKNFSSKLQQVLLTPHWPEPSLLTGFGYKEDGEGENFVRHIAGYSVIKKETSVCETTQHSRLYFIKLPSQGWQPKR